MSGPTRFKYGVNNLPGTHPLRNLPVPFTNYSHIFQTDFDQFPANDWTSSGVGTPTAALVAGNGGVLAIGTSAAASDTTLLTKNPTAFAITAGYQAAFFTRVAIDNIAQNSTWVIGMTAGTPLAPTDGIYFTKAAAALTLVGNIRKAGVSTTVAVPLSGSNIIIAATYLTIGWWYDGRNAGPNGASVQFFAGTSTPADFFDSVSSYYTGLASITDMTNLPVVGITPNFSLQTNTANVRTMSIDYVTAWADLVR